MSNIYDDPYADEKQDHVGLNQGDEPLAFEDDEDEDDEDDSEGLESEDGSEMEHNAVTETPARTIGKAAVETPLPPASLGDPTLIMQGLSAMQNEQTIRAESFNFGQSFESFLNTLPRLKEIAEACFLVLKAEQEAKTWDELAPLVTRDIAAILSTFKVSVNADFVAFAVKAALATVQAWAPKGVGLFANAPQSPLEGPTANETGTGQVETPQTDSKASTALSSDLLHQAKAEFHAKGFMVVKREKYETYKESHSRFQDVAKTLNLPLSIVPSAKSEVYQNDAVVKTPQNLTADFSAKSVTSGLAKKKKKKKKRPM